MVVNKSTLNDVVDCHPDLVPLGVQLLALAGERLLQQLCDQYVRTSFLRWKHLALRLDELE
jgi:hypothetical protein